LKDYAFLHFYQGNLTEAEDLEKWVESVPDIGRWIE
jgi:hypothetical protein